MIFRRRFLLSPSLSRLIVRERGGLLQVEGFFPPQRDRSSRVHLESNRATLILRTFDLDGETEEAVEVPVAHAHALLDVCAGAIEYTRTALPLHEATALVDQIVRPRLLHLVTVEFETADQARWFQPVAWFGPEVTNDPRYTSQSLALKGLDDALDIPLSDAALNSLLDALDGRFPNRHSVPANRPAAHQVPATRAKGQANSDVDSIDLADLDRAMIEEMQTALQKNRSE